MKKLISLALCLVTVLSVFALASCAENDSGKKKDEEEIVIEDTYLEELDFEGQVVTFAIYGEEGNYSNLGWVSCDVDEKNGDAVVDAVYDRNRLVEQRLNVEIDVALSVPSNTEFTKHVTPSLIAQTDDYNILWGQQANDIDLALEGYILDLTDYADDVNYIRYNEDWWAHQYMDYFRYDKEVFWLCSPLSMNYLGGAAGMLVNKRLYDANFEATYGNIYDYVREGKWTIDDMVEMSNTIYSDTNNNNKIDDGDIIGSAFASSWTIMQVLIGAGIECSTRNADGTVSFGVIKGNKKYVDTVQKIYDLFESCPGIDNSTTWKDYFAAGNQLFRPSAISTIGGAALREMPDDFYLIPSPKLDLKQEAYRAAMSDGNHLMGISYTCQNIAAATATLELMAYFNKKMVEDIYYEEALKYKFSRDDDTPEMIELVHNSVYVDFVLIWEKYLFNEHWIRYSGYKKNIASSIEKKQTGWLKTFDETIAQLKAASEGNAVQ